jgi:LmbE family N-acetylglucosaminyl deacetylase
MTSMDIGQHVPHLRPHNRVHDGKIYFMISSRPTIALSPAELSLYESIDGITTVSELEKTHPSACAILLKWHEARIIELLPQIMTPKRPHIVVIEPHMDDAALSAGGRLLLRRGRARITILSVVKWSNFTSYLLLNRNFHDIQAVTALRQQESELVAKFLGAEHRALDWHDAPIQFWPAEKWSDQIVQQFKKAPQAFVKLFPDPAEVSRLAEQLAEALADLTPDELWIPMGLGDHIDHRMTRSACLRMIVDHPSRFAGVPVSLYEDLPYAASEGHASEIQSALADSGAVVTRATEDITGVFEDKLRMVSIYASQFKLAYMEPLLRKFAENENHASGRLAETYYRCEQLSSLPHECRFSRESVGLEKLRDSAQRLSVNGDLSQLTIMALPSGQLGRWETIAKPLSESFPQTEFQIYASADVAWQINQHFLRRSKLHIVPAGGLQWAHWIGIFLRESSRRTPLIVLWRGAYAGKPMRGAKKLINSLIAMFLPFHRVLFARSLWDFCCMLRAEKLKAERTELAADLEVA